MSQVIVSEGAFRVLCRHGRDFDNRLWHLWQTFDITQIM